MELPKRKQPRLKEYDYNTPGAYFITICSHNRKNIFSNIAGEIHELPENKLTDEGKIVEETIMQLPDRFNIDIDKYVIMPNHIHLLLVVKDDERAIHESPLQNRRSLIFNVIGYLKMNSSKRIHTINRENVIWQRSFHDHIIRDKNDYEKIWEYIDTNILRWEQDCFYSNNTEK